MEIEIERERERKKENMKLRCDSDSNESDLNEAEIRWKRLMMDFEYDKQTNQGFQLYT